MKQSLKVLRNHTRFECRSK